MKHCMQLDKNLANNIANLQNDISNVFLGQTRGLEKTLICLYFLYTSSKANLIQMAKIESPPVTFLLILPVSKLLHKGVRNMCPSLIAYFPHSGHNDCSFSARTFDYSEKKENKVIAHSSKR